MDSELQRFVNDAGVFIKDCWNTWENLGPYWHAAIVGGAAALVGVPFGYLYGRARSRRERGHFVHQAPIVPSHEAEGERVDESPTGNVIYVPRSLASALVTREPSMVTARVSELYRLRSGWGGVMEDASPQSDGGSNGKAPFYVRVKELSGSNEAVAAVLLNRAAEVVAEEPLEMDVRPKNGVLLVDRIKGRVDGKPHEITF